MSSWVHSIFSISTTATTWLLTHLHPLDISLSLLALFLLLSLQQRLTSHPAVPMSWPILGLLPHLLLHHAHLHTWNTRVLSRCPNATYPISGLTRNFRGIVTADPIKVEYMLRTHFLNFPKGQFYRERFQELLGSGIFNVDGDAWRIQRRVAAAEMHTARFRAFSLETMRRLVHQKLLKLVARASAAVGNDDEGDQVVDLQEWLLRFTFDNVCVVALGVDPGCLDGEILPFARAFEVATECSLLRFLVPPVVWKGMRAVNVGTERKLKDAVKVVHEFADNVVKNRKADMLSSRSSNVVNGGDVACGGSNDLLSRLMIMRVQEDYDKGVVDEEYSRNKKMNSARFSDEFLRDFCISFILAGRDTSSVALAWFFWLVHENPRVEEKILQEIKQIVSLRKSRTGSSTIDVEEEEEEEEALDLDEVGFDADELDSMVYLEAALTEAMRLYPPVPIDFKEVEKDDTYPDGTPVKKGDKVFYHTFAMGRLPFLWGNDAEEFTPERWLKNSNDGGGGGGVQQVAAVSPFKYAVFNGGPRLCVGKRFAYVQMKMVAASVLVRFKVKVVKGQVITPRITTTLYMKNGLKVTFHPR